MRHLGARAAILAYLLAITLFLLGPVLVVMAISVNPFGYAIFPPQGFSMRWYLEVLNDPQWRASIRISLLIALVSTVFVTGAGTLAAVGLRRWTSGRRDGLVAVLMSPLLLPGLITGLAILFFFSLIGVLGATWTLILGHAVITYPYVLRLVYAALARDTATYEEAARTLGASPVVTFFQVTLPLIRSGIFGGAIFAFIISFDNITVSIFLSNPRMITLPIRILEHIQWSGTPSVAAISTMMVVVTGGLALLIERIGGLQSVFGGVSDESR
jgi:putative spermidine/putrescine transport system permease protein